jgi:hypothetical protein
VHKVYVGVCVYMGMCMRMYVYIYGYIRRVVLWLERWVFVMVFLLIL